MATTAWVAAGPACGFMSCAEATPLSKRLNSNSFLTSRRNFFPGRHALPASNPQQRGLIKAMFTPQPKSGGGLFDGAERDNILGPRQLPTPPRPPSDPTSEQGYLLFPKGYLAELSTLPIYVREDVRRCVCMVAGGVYEQLLFFPVLEQLRRRYPGVVIDVVVNERAKQAYELTPNVARTIVFDWEPTMMEPAEYADLNGTLKNGYYEMIISTRPAGIGHAITLFIAGTRQRVGFVDPTVNGVGAAGLLTCPLPAKSRNLAEQGVFMYDELLRTLDSEPPEAPTVRLAVSDALREYAEYKAKKAGVGSGPFLLAHGLESYKGGKLAAGSLLSKGDYGSVLPLEAWKVIISESELPVLLIVPQQADVEVVKNALGEKAHVVYATTPGMVAALVERSQGVVSTHTVAVPLALALGKPLVAMFSSRQKVDLFVPEASSRNCTVVASTTGKFADINLDRVIRGMQELGKVVVA